MSDLIAAAETAVNPYLVWIKVGLFALAVVGLLGTGFYAGTRWDDSKIADLKLADANFAKAATKQAADRQLLEDGVVVTGAVSEGQAQANIQTKYITLTKEIDHDVPSTVACIPVGLIRVFNGAAAGSDAPDASFAPGEPDDACSPVTWRSLAADIADDYHTANANAEQLNALEKEITDLHTAYNKGVSQ